MVSAKQRAARARFSAIMKSGGFGRRRAAKRARKASRSYSRTRVSTMAKRTKRRGGRKSFGGMGSLIKPALVGIAVAMTDAGNKYIPISTGFNNALAAGGISYLLTGKGNVKSAAVAAGTAHFSPIITGGQAGAKLSW